MKKLIYIMVCLMMFGVITFSFIGCNDKSVLENNTLIFKRKLLSKQNYVMHRIPGIIVTKNDTVITYFEARDKTSDWANIDIVMYRSTDKGDTFSEMIKLVDGINVKKTVNNPVMIVGEDNTIHFLYCIEYAVEELGGGVFYRKSIDDGVTFSEPIEITSQTAAVNDGVNVLGLGPGHGIQTRDNVLIIPVWYVIGEEGSELASHHPATISTLYSLDNGISWQMGEIIPDSFGDANETALVELSDGRIMANIRVPGTGYRGIAVSPNGYSDWSEIELDMNLEDPTCFGSILSMNIEHIPYSILFINCNSKKSRRNLTLRLSTDDGNSYHKSIVIRKGKAGYADIAHDSEGNIYIAYEIYGGFSAAVARISIHKLQQ